MTGDSSNNKDALPEHPHEALSLVENGAISALHAIVYWHRHNGLPPRETCRAILGSDEGTIRGRIRTLGERLQFPGELIAQGPQRSSRWHLTPLGVRLAALAPRILNEIDGVVRDMLRDIADDPWVRPHIEVGCFNAAVKLFLSQAFGTLKKDRVFPYSVRLNRNMNLRKVNSTILLDRLGDPFHYVVVPLVYPRGQERLPSTIAYQALYEWSVLVILPDDHPLRHLEILDVQQVWDACRHHEEPLPLLVSPGYNATRILLDRAFSAAEQFPLDTYLVENPDSVTRFEWARNGHGIAIVGADTIPSVENAKSYPSLMGPDGEVLRGQYVIAWRGSSGSAAGPSGVDGPAHGELCRAISATAKALVCDRPGVVPL